jgi:hypothetical protein
MVAARDIILVVIHGVFGFMCRLMTRRPEFISSFSALGRRLRFALLAFRRRHFAEAIFRPTSAIVDDARGGSGLRSIHPPIWCLGAVVTDVFEFSGGGPNTDCTLVTLLWHFSPGNGSLVSTLMILMAPGDLISGGGSPCDGPRSPRRCPRGFECRVTFSALSSLCSNSFSVHGGWQRALNSRMIGSACVFDKANPWQSANATAKVASSPWCPETAGGIFAT